MPTGAQDLKLRNCEGWAPISPRLDSGATVTTRALLGRGMGLGMRRRATEPVDPCWRLREEHQKFEETIKRFKSGINALIDEHKPYMSEAEMLHPGWGARDVRFWCTQCRQPWPCKFIHALRHLYGEATGWDGALQDYQPLVLKPAPQTPGDQK